MAREDEVENAAPDSVASVIQRRSGDIAQRWARQVARDFGGPPEHPALLQEALPHYLRRLSDALRRADWSEDGDAAAWLDLARRHAITHVRLGFDVEQLVRELNLLRRTLFDSLRDEGLLGRVREVERLLEFLDAATVESVKTYVESRDHEVAQLEAQHVEFVTHELRNPLATATVAASQLRRADERWPARGRTLELLEGNLRRVRSLIDDLFLVERFEAGTIAPQPVDLDLGALLADALGAAQKAAGKRGIELRTAFDPGVQVHLDPQLTAGALHSVLRATMDLTESGRIDLRAEDRGTDVLVEIRDARSGFARADLRMLFEPFRRSSTSRRGKGLVLAVARRTIEAQGGAIRVDRDGSSGCRFEISLPKPRH